LAGRFGELDASLAETETLARLGSYHNLARSTKSMRRGRAFITSGDLEAFGLAAAEDLAPGLLGTIARIQVAYADFLSGRTESALRELAQTTAERYSSELSGVSEANVAAVHAWAGEVNAARRSVEAQLPHTAQAGRTNLRGQWGALSTLVQTLGVLGDKPACAALYPAAVDLVETGFVVDALSFGTNTAQLTAAIAAGAAGLDDKSRDHFEQALAFALALPHRLLQPIVRFWYGRMLVESRHMDDRARGLGLLAEADADFGALKMVLHQRQAAAVLRAART
jgi:hypothetical protein